jgi:YesN/AraC family two-component response regulator
MEKPTILIVDDEISMTKSLERSLRGQFTILTANSSREALEILARNKIEVLLTDQRMPGLSGVELLAEAQKIKPETVGILFSGYSDTNALIDALNLGNVRGFLSKPWSLEQIQNILSKAVESYEVFTGAQNSKRITDEMIADLNAQIIDLRRLLDLVSIRGGQDPSAFSEMEITRQRDQQLREAESMERLSSGASTQLTAQIYGTSGLKNNLPDLFDEIVKQYSEVLDLSVEKRVYKVEGSPSELLRQMADQLGFLRAGARDVIDIHNSAFIKKINGKLIGKSQIYIEEGRITALELMGYLVSFYRFYYLGNYRQPRSVNTNQNPE